MEFTVEIVNGFKIDDLLWKKYLYEKPSLLAFLRGQNFGIERQQ